MKVKIPVALLVVALLVAYVLGTERGRAGRDSVLSKLGRAPGSASSGEASQAA